MGASIDERVVYMKFDNKNFEQNAEESLKTLDKLKESLKFKDVQDKLGDIDLSDFKRNINSIGDIDDSKINGVLDKIEYRMSTLGQFTGRIVQNIADDIYDSVKRVFDGIDRIVTYAENGIVQGGYKRASNIQSAKFQLEGMGISWNEIKGDIEYAVNNTAYSLDQAAIVASQLTASGLKPGDTYVNLAGIESDIDTMAMVLRSISGTAAGTGGNADYADIGRIFMKMMSYGKVYASQLNELGTYGIGAKAIVADYFSKVGYQGKTDWTEADISAITSDKNSVLEPMLVIEAMYEKFGEHAVKANETLSGVMANTQSALARIGENFFTPIIENNGPMVHAFEVLRLSINDVNNAIKPFVTLLGKDVGGVIDKFVSRFAEKEDIIDEETGEVTGSKWVLKKKGGLFSDFLEPWTEGKWVEKPIPGQSDHTYMFYEEPMSRAAKIAQNIQETFSNIFDIVGLIGDNIGSAIRAVFPNAESFAGILVKIKTKIRDISEAWKNSYFLNGEGWKNSDLYHIVRGLAAAIDIVREFGSSFKKHIIDPIFNAGKSAIQKAGLWDYFVGFFDTIFEFDEKIKAVGNGDYFGPFLENVKDKLRQAKDKIVEFFSSIGPKIKDGFISVINWWKPVKEIIFDPKLSLSEKWSAVKKYFTENFKMPGWEKAKELFGKIGNLFSKTKEIILEKTSLGDKWESFKSYFTENFELPGWDKAKELFGKIGDIVDKVKEKIKDFLGFNKSKEITETGESFLGPIGRTIDKVKEDAEKAGSAVSAIGGTIKSILGHGDNPEEYGLSGVGDLFSQLQGEEASPISKMLDTVDEETEKLPTISERIATFFGNIKDTIVNFDFNWAKTLLGGFAVVLVLLVAAIAYAIWKIPKLISRFNRNFHQLAAGILNNFNNLLFELGKTMKAAKVEKYASAMKEVATAIGIVGGIFVILAVAMVVLAKATHEGELETAIDRAKDILIGITVAVAGLLLALYVAAGKLSTSLKISSGELQLSTTTDTLYVLANMFKAFIGSIIVLSLVIIGLGLIDLINEDIIDNGYKNMWKIVGMMAGLLAIILGLNFVFNSLLGAGLLKLKGLEMAAELTGLAAMFTGFVTSLLILAAAVAILGIIPTWIFEKGMDNIWTLTKPIIIGVGALLIITAVISRFGALGGVAIGGALFGLSSMLLATATGILIMAVALKKIANVVDNVDSWTKTIIALIAIMAVLILVPSILLLAYREIAGTENLKSGLFNNQLTKMSLMILAVGAASLLISKAITNISENNLGKTIWSFAIIAGLFAEMAGILAVLSNMNSDGLWSAAITMGILVGATLLMTASIDLLGSMSLSTLLKGGIAMIVGIGLLAAIAIGLNTASNDIGTEAIKTAGMVALMGLAMIPMAQAIGMLMKAVDATDMNFLEYAGVLAGFVIAVAALGGIATIMSYVIEGVDFEDALTAGAAMLVMAVAMVPMAAALSMLMEAMDKAGFGALQADLVMLGFAGMIYLIAWAAERLLIASSVGGNFLPAVAVLLGMAAGFAIIIAAFADLALKLSGSKINTTNLLVAGGIVVSLGLFMTLLAWFIVQLVAGGSYTTGTGAKLAAALLSFVVVSAAIYALSRAIIPLSKLDAWPMTKAGLMIVALGGILTLITWILMDIVAYGTPSNIGPALATLGTFITVALALSLVAQVVMQLAKEDQLSLWSAAGVIFVIGAVLTAMTAVIVIVSDIDWKGALAAMGAVLGCAASIYLVAMALKKIQGIELYKIFTQIVLMAGIIVVLGVIMAGLIVLSAAAQAFGVDGTLVILSFGAAMLSFALMMVAVGIMAYLITEAVENIANALQTFIETILSCKDKKEDLNQGMRALGEALIEGLIAGLTRLNEKLPVILTLLGSILDTLGGWIIDRFTKFSQFAIKLLEVLLGALAAIVTNQKIMGSLATIIDAILMFASGNAPRWAFMAGQIGREIMFGFLEGFFSPDLIKPIEEFWDAGGGIDGMIAGIATFMALKKSKYSTGVKSSRADAWDDVDDIIGNDSSKSDKSTWSDAGKERKTKDEDDGLGGIFKAPKLEKVEEEPENPNVAAAKRGSNQNNQLVDTTSDDIEEYSSEVTSGIIKSDMEEANDQTVETWDKASKNSWKKGKSKRLNPFTDTIGQSLTELDGDLNGGQLGTDIVNEADKTNNTFLTAFGRPTTGEAAATSIAFATSGNPVWNDSVTNSTTYLDSSVNNGEIGMQMTGVLGNLHNKFSSMLSNPEAFGLVKVAAAGLDIMTNPFTRLVFQSLATARENMESPIIIGIMKEAASAAYNAFLAQYNSAAMIQKTIPVGQAVAAGTYAGMLDPSSINKLKNAGYKVSDTVIAALKSKRGFDINSPSERTYNEITTQIIGGLSQLLPKDMAQISASGGTVANTYIGSIDDVFQSNNDNPAMDYFQARTAAANSAAADTGKSSATSLIEAFGESFDIGAMADTVKGNWESRVPDIQGLISGFSLDKGISGNIDYAKESWASLTGAFKDDSGNFDISWLFSGLSGQLKSGADNLKSTLGIDGDNFSIESLLGIDTLSFDANSFDVGSIGMTFSIDETSIDPNAFSSSFSEYGGWDANDLMDNNTIDLNVDVDDTSFKDFMSKQYTMELANTVPVTGGYQPSTVGNTYVNNYSYNQTNNSPTALSTREINRQNELLMSRRMGNRR